MNIKAKIRFICWLAATIVVALFFAKSLYLGTHLNTNVMDLLPKSAQNLVVDKAIEKFSRSMGKQLIFLIGSQDQTMSENAADRFFQELQQNPLLQNITYRIADNEQQAWGAFYFPHRLSLLNSAQKSALLQNNMQELRQNARFDLYSPMGIANAALLQSDPWFLFKHYLISLPNPASNIAPHHQRMMTHTDGSWWIMLNASLKDDSFSITNQNKIIERLQKSKNLVLNNFPNTQLFMTGMLFYAKAGADAAEHDITIIGFGSLLGIILLCWFTFRSLTPLVHILMSALIGFIAAFVVTQYVFGEVYLFTLVLGASLIGICVDYAFFYYADRLLGGAKWTATEGLKNIFSGISLGLLNIILAYAILAFTPFPGLRQLALFAIVGLTMAYATVVCAFPLLLKAQPIAAASVSPLLLRYTNKYLNLCSKLALPQIISIYAISALLAAGGIYRLKSNDDIRILESLPAALTQTEKQIKAIIGSNLGMDFYVVTGSTPEQTLENEHKLLQSIDKIFPDIVNKYMAINPYLPTLQEQKENFALITTKLLDKNLLNYLQQIGVNKTQATKIQKNLTDIKFNPLTIDEWLQSPISKPMRFLWLGKIESKFASVVLLSNKLNSLNALALKKIGTELGFATYVNKGDEVSQIFKIYREKISKLLALAYAALFILLVARYSLKKAGYCFLPPVMSGALSLGALGWLGIPLTLFNVLALVLTLGIAVDYVVFFAETKANYQSTMLATALSAIATLLSFGLLVCSTTPVIHHFGIVVLIGISSAFLLAPLSVITNHNKQFP